MAPLWETCSSDPMERIGEVPYGATLIATFHSHPTGTFSIDVLERFSTSDVLTANDEGASGNHPGYLGDYLATPSGSVYFYRANSLSSENVSADAIHNAQQYVGRAIP